MLKKEKNVKKFNEFFNDIFGKDGKQVLIFIIVIY